jgi:hypothetical protein
MPRVTWTLRHGRPCIEVVLHLAADGSLVRRTLLADTGAGSAKIVSNFFWTKTIACSAAATRSALSSWAALSLVHFRPT